MRHSVFLFLLLLVIPVMAKNNAGDIINLSIWKLTIPLDDDGDGVADEVTMPTLRLFEDPDFFELSRAKNSVIFRAHCGGATTEDSEFPRSELREMEKGGKDEASWGTTGGQVHNMAMKVAINAVPDENPRVICARVHDVEGDLLKVSFDEGRLLIDRRGEEAVVLEEEYTLGEFFTLMIIADNGRIRALYEGRQIMEWKIEAEELFFKAGAYPQSNVEMGEAADAFGEVEFEQLFVTHKW